MKYVVALLLLCVTASVHANAPYARPTDAQVKRCMVYLPAMKDAKLRRWCMKQQERMP